MTSLGNQAQGSRLASILPDSTDDTEAFTAVLDTEVTRIYVCNLTSGALTFSLWHVPAGGSVEDRYALFFDRALAANTTFELFADAPNSGVKLEIGDELWVQSSGADDIAFNIYGVTTSIAPGTNT